jgi:hypothetical protein
MTRAFSLLLALFLGVSGLRAVEEVRSDEKGTFLGVLVSPNVSPNASPNPGPDTGPKTANPGVRVSQVLPNSPAARADVHRDDVLLAYDGEAIRDGAHLAELIRKDKPERKVRLRLLRDSKEQTAEATLTLGPALTLAPFRLTAPASEPVRPRGPAGGANPASVCIVATPLEEGKLRVTVEYYATGKIQTVTGEGAAEIASMVQKLPERERNLVRVALRRLRSVNPSAEQK